MTANPRELVPTVSSSKYPIAVARLGRLDAKQTPHHGGARNRGASGAWLARRRARMTTAMDDLRMLCVLACSLDVIYQLLFLHAFSPLQALVGRRPA
jgi:hypothetical protein